MRVIFCFRCRRRWQRWLNWLDDGLLIDLTAYEDVSGFTAEGAVFAIGLGGFGLRHSSGSGFVRFFGSDVTLVQSLSSLCCIVNPDDEAAALSAVRCSIF